jgi:hypothetical protein
MGFAVYYRSTLPVSPAKAAAVARATDILCRGHTWLSCEPPVLWPRDDGHLEGGSKPNFEPHPDDAAAAALEGLPDGTTRDLLHILCQLSREHDIHWEISHDESGGPVGYIRNGVADDKVVGLMEAFAEIGDLGENLSDDFANADHDEDEPPILPFKPKGE